MTSACSCCELTRPIMLGLDPDKTGAPTRWECSRCYRDKLPARLRWQEGLTK